MQNCHREGKILGERCVMFCILKHLSNFTHHQATALLVFSASLNFWKPRFSPQAPCNFNHEGWETGFSLQDILLCRVHSIQRGVGNDFPGMPQWLSQLSI